jgi:hypothetical protein
MFPPVKVMPCVIAATGRLVRQKRKFAKHNQKSAVAAGSKIGIFVHESKCCMPSPALPQATFGSQPRRSGGNRNLALWGVGGAFA